MSDKDIQTVTGNEFPRYPSYDNLAKMLTCRSQLSEQSREMAHTIVFFGTLQIDGSNLGITAEHDGSTWRAITLHGRNSYIWALEANTTSDIRYGKSRIGDLLVPMTRFCGAIGNIVGVKKITVYGEIYTHVEGKNVQKFASWHPFAYVPQMYPSEQNRKIFKLTKETYHLFGKVCESLPNPVPHQEYMVFDKFFKYLLQVTSHVVCPPPVLDVGTIPQLVARLAPLFIDKALKEDKTFEGAFMIDEYGHVGFKWKTGLHDEQPQIAPLDKVLSIGYHPQMIGVYGTLMEVYKTRPAGVFGRRDLAKQADVKAQKRNDNVLSGKILSDTIEKAVATVLSKEISFVGVAKHLRIESFDRLTLLVVAEIRRTYGELVEEFNWTDEMMSKQGKTCVARIVMKQ